MLDVFEELQLAVRSLAEDWRAERLHDLLYRNRGPCELIFGGTVVWGEHGDLCTAWRAYHTSPKAPVSSSYMSGVYQTTRKRGNSPIPTGWRSTYLVVTYEQSVSDHTIGGEDADPEVRTSKEVPKMLSFTKDITVEQSQGGVKNSNGLEWVGGVGGFGPTCNRFRF